MTLCYLLSGYGVFPKHIIIFSLSLLFCSHYFLHCLFLVQFISQQQQNDFQSGLIGVTKKKSNSWVLCHFIFILSIWLRIPLTNILLIFCIFLFLLIWSNISLKNAPKTALDLQGQNNIHKNSCNFGKIAILYLHNSKNQPNNNQNYGGFTFKC